MIVTVRRTFSIQCPMRHGWGDAAKLWKTNERDTPDEAWQDLFAHFRKEHADECRARDQDTKFEALT